jgi:hypothetical protein
MNSLTWQKAKNATRNLYDHGYDLDLETLAAMIVQQANLDKATLEQVVQAIITANDFETGTRKFDRRKALRELGY